MNESRETVFERIRKALAGEAALPRPAVTPMDPDGRIRGVLRGTDEAALDPAARLERFRTELEALAAGFFHAPTAEAAAERIAEELARARVERLAVAGEPGGPGLLARLGSANLELEPRDGLDRAEGRRLLAAAGAVLTGADYGLSRTGTLVFTPTTLPDRLAAGLPPWHIAVLRRENLLTDVAELLEVHPEVKQAALLMVSGPSRTADIEKILILGVHGPKRLLVLLVG